ncbi:MAG: CpsD/CapB family tyrosine-protein kinase [Armatimonadota bacterium]
MLPESSPDPEAESSPERLAMQHLQGRIKNKLRSKQSASDITEEEATIAPLLETATVPERQAIRIDKGDEGVSRQYAAGSDTVSQLNFKTDTLTSTALFQSSTPVVLGVTSAVAGEGKTTVALHLAMSIARDYGKDVCLMDLSLGSDTLSQRLGISTEATGTGLLSLLEGTETSISAIQTIKYDRISVLPSGGTPADAARAARSPAILELLNAGRESFDVVIVDLPPVTSGNVSPIVAHLDAILMVIDAGVASKETVAGALERLDQSKVLGIVLNRSSTPASS